jgi:hypothetical protein
VNASTYRIVLYKRDTIQRPKWTVFGIHARAGPSIAGIPLLLSHVTDDVAAALLTGANGHHSTTNAMRAVSLAARGPMSRRWGM